MLNDFTGGGQIFLHKLRMFMQVLNRSFFVAFSVSVAIVCLISYKPAQILDLKAAMTYQRALFINGIDHAMHDLRVIINPRVKYHFSKIDAWTSYGLYAKDVEVHKIVSSSFFIKAYSLVTNFLYARLLMLLGVMSGILLLIYLIWSRFGKDVSSEKHISGARIKTAKEVANYLRSIGKVSYLKIADMPLVKDAETKHIIITGTTGSGKTNLINNIVPQIIKAAQPALVVDQTGEMIARYYDASRGDIIFNPLDARSHSWDFWTDNSASDIDDNNTNSRLEKFAKVLFKYGKKPHSNSDPFWDNSAQIIFCACVEHLIATNNKSIAQLCYMLNSMSLKSLAASLVATKAARYLTNANSITANSILSVMTTNTKPLNLLRESARQFSLKQYFTGVKNNNPAWLFLSSAPDLREVTMPLTACLFELAISHLIAMGVNQNRRMWFIIDELASLGRLNGFATLMSEGRKYGGCVLAATQSISQLFENFGQYGASHIFGQFATKFLFRTDDPISAKIIADIFGQLEYSHQQKNTSFGANEFRDGISYTEQQRHKPLITTDDLASLADHQCFVGLPEPLVRIAKIKVPVAFNIQEKHQAFIARSVMIDQPQQRAAESDDSDIEREPTIDQPIDAVLDDHKLATDQHELDPILTKQAIF